MKKLFRLLFPKYKIHHASFLIGTTGGMKRHGEFIEHVNKENIEIINSYITYHSYSDSHRPESINYVVKIRK